MKRTLLSIVMLAATLTLSAIPAKRVTRTFTIGGRQVQLTLTGDETLHYWRAADGTAYRLDANGVPQAFDLSAAEAGYNQQKRAPKRLPSQAAPKRNRYIGQKKGLVILVSFADNDFTISSDPKPLYEDVMSKEGYSGHGQYGSVRDYFKAQSYGQFDFVLDVAGPVKLSKNMVYYGGNDSNGSDQRPAHMVKEACQLVKDEVNFADYDWDGDGLVEQVFVIYAGYGEAQGASENTIWPHAWDIYSGTNTMLKLDGVYINSYACGSELTGTYGTKMDGIGTVCHEFSHCFGLPDFYDTTYTSEFTMGEWSLMDVGSYSNDGYCPAAYTAYERWFCGWLEPKVLDEGCEIENMSPLNESGEAYVIYNKGNANEYYLLQNIQKTSWSSYAKGHGLLVLHVDYDETEWYNNTPNNTASHLRMSPICADNKATSTTLSGDPYPGTSKKTALTDSTTPAATLFNKNSDGRKFMGRPIENITEVNSLISFTFNGGFAQEPVAPATELTLASLDEGTFTVEWQPSAEAASYTLSYGTYDPNVKEGAVYLNDTFDFERETDGTVDISAKLDQYLPTEGYTGKKLFNGKSGLKLGSASTNGYLMTPTLNFENETAHVKIVANQYSSKVSTLTISSIDATGNVIDKSDEVSVESDGQVVECDLSVNGPGCICIDAGGRVYIASLCVNEGDASPYGEATTVSGLTECAYTIDIDESAVAYYVKVCAVADDERQSEWTEPLIVTLPTSEDNIGHASAVLQPGVCYDLQGRVAKPSRGVYLMRQNGKTHKLIKKD